MIKEFVGQPVPVELNDYLLKQVDFYYDSKLFILNRKRAE